MRIPTKSIQNKYVPTGKVSRHKDVNKIMLNVISLQIILSV